MLETITFNSQLPPAIDGKAPEWVQLTPSGTFRGRDGRGPFSVDPAAVAAASTALPAVIDEMHSTDLQGPIGGAAPARGWIVELQARADGVWGRVDWTPEGAALVVGRAYRGISPALASDKASGRVSRVLRAGLTNLPNFEMTTLHSTQQDPTMDLDKLRTALGLKADASFDDCMAAIGRTVQAVSTHAADLGRLAKAAGAPANTDVAGIETVLAARPGATEATRMAQEIVSLNTQLGELRTNAARERAVVIVDRALADGKPITALRDHYITRHMADPAAVELELGAMLSLHGRGVKPSPAGGGGDGIPDDELAVAQRMGLTREQAIEQRKQRMSGGRG